MSRSYVAYYRVSTKRQGQSGLGLEAQKQAVSSFLGTQDHLLLGEFVETESGTSPERPQLQMALEACRLHRARLVIAKLDRLARNAAFLLNLRDAGVDFVCCDMPDANRLTIGILAMVAEDEAERISERTTAALAAAKQRGVVLGKRGPENLRNPRLGSKRGTAALRTRADERAEALRGVFRALKKDGLSLRQMAMELNSKHIPAPRGGKWSATQVSRVQKRLEASREQPAR